MLPRAQKYIPEARVSYDDLVIRMSALEPGETLTLVGVDQVQFAAILAERSTATAILRLELLDIATASVAIDRILDDLAELAASQWPNWPVGGAPKALSPYLPSWRRAATRFVVKGRPPRFRRLARETELVHLLSVLPDLLLLSEIDPLRGERAAPIIAALDWCRRRGVAVVYLLPVPPEAVPPWDRVLHGAIAIEPPPAEPASQRLILPATDTPSRGSAIERRMREALCVTPDLAGLFEDEVTLQLGHLGPTPRVDLLWRDGKVVVELDGPEHERDPNYGADRHRDYELLVAGYLVLRLTNAEVELDLGHAIEKVRRVVNLRRAQP
jgi:hypothetical protein